MSKKAVLIILDGYGIAPATPGNAIATAKSRIWINCSARIPTPSSRQAALRSACLRDRWATPEVGHTNIGAGRVVFQILPKISQEIENGKFFQNPVYIKAMDDAKNGGHALHVMGLLSTGGVHSHLHHIFAALDMASGAALRRSMSIASSTDATSRPRAARALSRSFRKSAMSLATPRLPLFRDASGAWIVTSAGIA